MRIGLVVDSACDLPAPFFESNKVTVLPISVKLDGKTYVDTRDAAATAAFYRDHTSQKGRDAETAPLSVDEIRELFLSRLVIEYDYVFGLTIAASRSPIFQNATQAALAILNAYKPYRQKAGVQGPFAVRVIDTQNFFAGQGVSAVECVRLIKAGESATRIRERLDHLVQNTYGYMLPRDLYFLRARAQKKGDRSVGWLSAALGTALDIKPVLRAHRAETGPVAKVRGFDEGAQKLFGFLADRIRAGLLTPTLCFSYGGELKEMETLPGYTELMRTCKTQKIEVFTSVMSMTGAINVGEGALAVGFAAEPHEFPG